MVYINKIAIENFMGPISGQIKDDQAPLVISLFVVSSKNQRLKALCLDHLTSEDRRNKLHQWGKENRFVLVIEKGDQVYAHVQAQRAEELKNREDITINNKKVTVQTLSEDDSALLNSICEEYEKFAIKKEEKSQEGEQFSEFNSSFFSYDHLTDLLGHITSSKMIESIKFSFQSQMKKIIDNCMERFKEARREEQERVDKEQKLRDIISKDIQLSELRFETHLFEVKKLDIKKKEGV